MNNFQDTCLLLELEDLEPVSLVQVKDRLQDNIAFWKDIRGSRWMVLVSVIENGDFFPFKSLPARRKFQNRSSVVQN